MTTGWSADRPSEGQQVRVNEYISLLKEISHAKTYVRNLETRALAARTEAREEGVQEGDLRHFERAVETGDL